MAEIHGDRVILRPLKEPDAARLRELRPHRWASDAEWPLEPTSSNRYVVLLDGTIVGLIQSGGNPEPEYRHASIDIFIGEPWRGRGLGTDAVRTLALHLTHEQGHHRVVIDPRLDNTVAIRCYKKVGFKPVGVMRRYELDLDTGEWHDGLLMDLLPEDLDTQHT